MVNEGYFDEGRRRSVALYFAGMGNGSGDRSRQRERGRERERKRKREREREGDLSHRFDDKHACPPLPSSSRSVRLHG